MKKQLVIIGIVTILVCVGLSGCEQVSNTLSPEKNRFVGTWKNTTSHVTLNLFSDGKCSMWGNTGTWDLKDENLLINLTSAGVPFTYTYIFLFFNNDKTLKLIPTISTTGTGYVLYKQ